MRDAGLGAERQRRRRLHRHHRRGAQGSGRGGEVHAVSDRQGCENPGRVQSGTVAEYRLVGYETRLLAKDDFNNDKVDAGDVGSGHTVTALYEIVPVGGPRAVEVQRYTRPAAADTLSATNDGEYAFIKIRYKLPTSMCRR